MFIKSKSAIASATSPPTVDTNMQSLWCAMCLCANAVHEHRPDITQRASEEKGRVVSVCNHITHHLVSNLFPLYSQALIEIICSRYPNELQSVLFAYKTKFNRDLVADIRSETRGDFERVLVACLHSQRPMGPEVDMNRAQYDADALYKAGVGRIGTSEGEFIRIFCTQSSAQMCAMADVYARKYGHGEGISSFSL